MKKRAIIHIGTEKTGTTTIQEFLFINRKMLQNKGIAFPKSIGEKNHHQLATYCMSDERTNGFLLENNLEKPKTRKKWRKKFISAFYKELDEFKNYAPEIIISSEHFSLLLKDTSEIITLKQTLENYFDEIRIIVYLRRQDLLVTSRYSTVCKFGFITDQVFNKGKTLHYYDYQKLLEKWSNVFGEENIVPRVFEKNKFIDHNLLSDFMYCADIQKTGSFIIPKNENESISKTAQNVALYFNKHFPKDINGRPDEAIRKLRFALIDKINDEFPGPGKKSLRCEAVDFYNYFRESNQLVAKKWFDRDMLFSEDFSMYPEVQTNEKFDPQLLDTIFALFAEKFSKKV